MLSHLRSRREVTSRAENGDPGLSIVFSLQIDLTIIKIT